MTKEEFLQFWKEKKDIDGTPAVGIGIFWENVPAEGCTVQQYFGDEAWKKIGEYWAPHWGSFTRTKLKEWLNTSRPDYKKFINEEQVKIDFYNIHGLVYPNFCAFADETGSVGSLGDGCHRYIDCNFLMISGKDMRKDIEKCRLDVLCVPNLQSILSRNDIPPDFYEINK